MKEIQTNGTTILLVEVPEDAIDFTIDKHRMQLTATLITEGSDADYFYKIPQGNYQIIGKSNELSKEQMEVICEHGYCSTNGIVLFNDYLNEDNTFDNITESYLSLLEANGVVDRNQIEKPDESEILEDCEDWIYARAKYKSLLEQWNEFESKVKHYLVLIKYE